MNQCQILTNLKTGMNEKLFKQSPIPSDEIMTQLGLYIRGSYLVKFLVLNDLYLKDKDLPGDILSLEWVDITWWFLKI